MKNMFKMMGVALLAGAMLFTACKKDKEDTTPNTPAVVPAVSVNFNGTEWTSDVAMDYVAAQSYYDVYKTVTDPAYMQFRCERTVGTHGLGDANTYVIYWDENDVEYNTTKPEGIINITAIDIAGKTMSATIAATFVKDAVEYPLTATLTNAKWDIVND